MVGVVQIKTLEITTRILKKQEVISNETMFYCALNSMLIHVYL